MKIEVNNQSKSEKITYSAILRFKNDDLIIFAPSKESNSVVLVGDDDWEGGEYFGDFDESDYEIFRGTITLSN